jgi:hypothetical protein
MNPLTQVVNLDVVDGRRIHRPLDHVTAFEKARLPASSIERVAEYDGIAFAAVHVFDHAAWQEVQCVGIASQNRGR